MSLTGFPIHPLFILLFSEAAKHGALIYVRDLPSPARAPLKSCSLCLKGHIRERREQKWSSATIKTAPEMNSVFPYFFFQPSVQPVPDISGFDRGFPGAG